MNLVLAIIAAVAALAGVGLLWWRSRVGRELGLMQSTETSQARDAAKMAPGSLVELKGVLRSDAPLKGEFSGSECVYYRALVEREIERVTTDSEGKRDRRREFETVSSTERHVPARIEDSSGAVAIDFEGAKVEAIESHKRYEAGSGIASLVGSLLDVNGTTLGHRYTEWILPAGIPIYVLGSVLANGAVGVSPTGANPFVISHKSEEERTKSLNSTRLWLLVATVIAFAAAAGLLAWSFAAGPIAPSQ